MTAPDCAPVLDEKECAVCAAVAKRDGYELPLQIFNTKSQMWHGGGDWGVTSCGKDASREWWIWRCDRF